MPLPIQTLHIPLGGTIDEKTSRLARGLPVLRHVYNARQDHLEEQRKRRGYTRLSTATTVHGETIEPGFVSLGIDNGCLVVMGLTHVYSVAANANAVHAAALVRRGPAVVGCYRMGTVKVSALRRET